MRSRLVLFSITLIMILSACGTSNKSSLTSTPPPTNTPVPLSTLTATPVIPLAILVLPTTLDTDTANLYEKTVYDLTQSAGMRFQVRNALTAADFEPGLQISHQASKTW